MPKISLLTKVYINKIRSGRTSGEAAQNDGTEESKSTQPRLYENLPNPVQSVFSALSQGLEEDILESSIGLHGQ